MPDELAGDFDRPAPVPIDGALVCVVLQLRKAAYAVVPRLGEVSQLLHSPVPCSLVDHAIREASYKQ